MQRICFCWSAKVDMHKKTAHVGEVRIEKMPYHEQTCPETH